jgi:sec-independent protein translocase protein TatC
MAARPRRRPKPDDGRMPVMDHLRELRRRIIVMIVLIALGAIVGWYLYPHTLTFLKHPYCSVPAKYRVISVSGPRCSLIYHGALDGFTTRLKVSVITGAIFTAPLWLYQIWAFITPGLRKNERRYSITFVAASTVLFAAGMTLAYLVLSKGLRVLLEQSGYGTQAQLTINDYISFVTLMLVVFGAAFELPLLVTMANLAGVLPAKWLRKSQRIAIFLIFLFAAVATPSTDPFTMCAMAIPMVVLFEASVLGATIHDRRKARRRVEEQQAAQLDDSEPSAIDPIPKQLDSSPRWSDST